METYTRPQFPEQVFKDRVIQNGNTRDNKNLPTGREVGNIHRFQRCILPHTDSKSVQEVHVVSRPGSVLPVQTIAIWSVDSSDVVHGSGEGGQTVCITKRCKDPPVSRRLVGQMTCLQHKQIVVALCQELG